MGTPCRSCITPFVAWQRGSHVLRTLLDNVGEKAHSSIFLPLPSVQVHMNSLFYRQQNMLSDPVVLHNRKTELGKILTRCGPGNYLRTDPVLEAIMLRPTAHSQSHTADPLLDTMVCS